MDKDSRFCNRMSRRYVRPERPVRTKRALIFELVQDKDMRNNWRDLFLFSQNIHRELPQLHTCIHGRSHANSESVYAVRCWCVYVVCVIECIGATPESIQPTGDGSADVADLNSRSFRLHTRAGSLHLQTQEPTSCMRDCPDPAPQLYLSLHACAVMKFDV